jgi:translocation and assembly module TamA
MRSILQLAAACAVEPPVRLLAVLLAFFVASVACAQSGLKYRVEIDAPKNIAEILKKGLSLVRWEGDPQMTPEQLRRLAEEAVREGRETAATEGYFSAVVEVSIDEGIQPWIVLLTVDEGERTLIGDIDLRFTGPAVDDERSREIFKRVRDTFPLRRGQPFRQADWDAAKRRAARELGASRYAAARVGDSRALVDPDTRRASLMIELASGPPYRFGEIRVSGVKRYSDRLVENLSPFRAGDDYDRDKLVVYQRRLLESGYFVSVVADIDVEQSQPQGAPVRVAVLEANKHHVEAGIGYSTDAGPRLELRYNNQDMFGSAWRSRSGLRLDNKIKNLQFDFDSPPRPGGVWNSFFARARETDIQNQTTRELAAGTAYNWDADLLPSSLIMSGHIEQQRVGADVTDNRHALYFGFRRTFRKTDDFISPRSGYLAMFEVGGAPPALASRPFVRGVVSASFFVPIARRDDLLLRGQAGRVVADSREGIPSTFLFRTGGDQTVRGYAFESLGVHQDDAIVGGRRYVVLSTEYTHWVGDNWGIAAFVDAGNAWDDTTLFKAARGYGFGGRFRTPIGPIRADLAYGDQSHQIRLHFSVGYTF